MLIVEGYRMAEGTATIQFLNKKPFEVNGVFLYRPDTNLWYIAPCKEFPWGYTFKKDELVEIVEGGKTAV